MCWRVGVEELGELRWDRCELKEHCREESPDASADEGDADGDKDGTCCASEPVGGSLDSAKGRVNEVGNGSHGGPRSESGCLKMSNVD